MKARQQLLQELEQVPDFIIEEVLNFLLFLKARVFQRNKLGSSSETVTKSSDSTLIDWVDNLTSGVPIQEWEKLPSDLSCNLDYYLYGSPKEK